LNIQRSDSEPAWLRFGRQACLLWQATVLAGRHNSGTKCSQTAQVATATQPKRAMKKDANRSIDIRIKSGQCRNISSPQTLLKCI